MRSLLAFPLLCLTCLTFNVQAINLEFLNQSVLTEFTEEETNKFIQFVGEQLTALKDHETASWRSGSNQIQGKIKVMFSYAAGDKACRRLRILLKGETGKVEPFQHDVCFIDKKWEIQDTHINDYSDSDKARLKKNLNTTLSKPLKTGPFTWYNPQTGNTGSSIVISEGDGGCRQVALSTHTKSGKSLSGTYEFCKTPEGIWKERPLDFSIADFTNAN